MRPPRACATCVTPDQRRVNCTKTSTRFVGRDERLFGVLWPAGSKESRAAPMSRPENRGRRLVVTRTISVDTTTKMREHPVLHVHVARAGVRRIDRRRAPRVHADAWHRDR